MPSAITRNKPNRRPRTLKGQQRPMQSQVPIEIVSATQVAGEVTIVFNQQVRLAGIPQFPNTNGAMPSAAEMTSPTTVVLTYPSGPIESTGITISPDDPSIRNSSGGFVSATTVEV